MGCSADRRPSGGVFSTGWCSRSTAPIRAASTRWNDRSARATGCWNSRARMRTGSMPSSMKPRKWRSRSPRRAPKPCGGLALRARDAAAGRTTDGPHLTDLDVLYGPKGIAAAQASTGEQKALLISLVLAHAKLVTAMTGFAPVLLLDEVIAHLDPGRRAALYDALAALSAQVWMTGADPAPFADV